MKDRIGVGLGAFALLLHLAVANRFDIFRDELYFIVCGRHPAFGYADQPPLAPLLAASLYGLGHQVWLLRLPCALAAGALVVLTVAFVRLLRGGDAAAWAAGIATATCPMFLGLSATLNTTTFEPLAWEAVAYALARAAVLDDRRALLWGGAVAGLAMEAKYALPAWLIGIAAGVALTAQRRLLTRRELWAGLALATILALPSVAWQSAHDWPFRALLAAAGAKNTVTTPPAFFVQQILVMNPLLAPLWIAGIVAPFVRRDLAPVRFVAIAYVAVAILLVLTPSKDYYLAPSYAPLFAIGAVALERALRPVWVRALYLGVATALSAVAAPLALPLLSPPALLGYMHAMHLGVTSQEKGTAGSPLPQTFADELGWHDFVGQVVTAWNTIPPLERTRTSIYVDNYGEAGALDVFGPAYGLPAALSGHNQYGLWGLRGQKPLHILRVHRELPPPSSRICSPLRVLGETFSVYAMPYENGKKIFFCGGGGPWVEAHWESERFMV